MGNGGIMQIVLGGFLMGIIITICGYDYIDWRLWILILAVNAFAIIWALDVKRK